MTYLLPTILKYGWPLVLVPLLIHLINLRRRRVVEWAAMDFLLESQKRNRKWIVLRQLLLWLLRTLAVAVILGMLAKPVIQPAWAKFFGAGVTHHIFLLDDSYSMSDEWDDTTAFAEAKAAIQRLLTQANNAEGKQTVTIIRFSEAESLSVGATSEFSERDLNGKLLEELSEQFGSLRPSESMAGPVDALQAALRLPDSTADESRTAYVVSDYRQEQWREETQLAQLVKRFREQVDHLRLVQCVTQSRANLAITKLEPEDGLRAANVETWYSVEVTNYSEKDASEVTVLVEADKNRLPAIRYESISPGESATQRIRVNFQTAGTHALTARIDPSSVSRDPIRLDNTRYFAASFPKTMPLLIIDGSKLGDDGYFLKTALSPGGKSLAGWNPQVERIDFLRRHAELERFAAIFLLDVPQLDRPEIEALENYVDGGGGLAIFLGPQTERSFYNSQLYRDGKGLMPVPIDRPTQLLVDRESQLPEVRVTRHPIFRMFTGQRNGFLELVRTNFYFSVDPQSQAGTDEDTKVIARLRNDSPFVVEKQLGAGRVVAQLCKLSPRETQLGVWSNWGVNP
ncbi:MAG: BatA domain-containing protein, partial [Lacipirellulaceae bacterium]